MGRVGLEVWGEFRHWVKLEREEVGEEKWG